MKNLLSWKSVAISLGLVALLAAPVSAQTPAIRVDVPFAFTAADQALPAGTYRFTLDFDRSLVRIASEDSTQVWMARLVPGASSRSGSSIENGMLRFHRYGTHYLLTDVWRAGSVEGNAVAKSRVPRELGSVGAVRDVKATK